MFEFELSTLLICILIAFVGGIIRGFTGFAGSLFMMPCYAIVLGPIEAMNVIIVSGLVGTSFTVRRAIKYSQKRVTLFYSLGLCVGVFFGLNFLFQKEITEITFYMGVFIIVGTLILFSGWRYRGPQTRIISLGFGWVTGLFSGFFGVPTGPFTGIYFLSSPVEKNIIQSNIQLVIICTILSFFAYFIFIEGFDVGYLTLGFVMSVPLSIGLKAGIFLFDRVSELYFRNITYAVLFFLGIALIFSS
ncbi:sulfite exporter TauE/SafE family protein [Alphaproteobacteria bacterium]|nr:sulfite exporter TauE/SafE family protein [Alphaproteobacteria bacterium]